MKCSCYLVFDRRGIDRCTKGLPGMNSGEFAVRLHVEIPDAVFNPAVADVEFTIPPRAVVMPVVRVEGQQEDGPEWSIINSADTATPKKER